jgi:dTMP kinase
MGCCLFLVFEGIDGSGKGTVIEMARRWLIKKGMAKEMVLVTHEPSDSESGRKAREILKKEKNPAERMDELLSLYMKDREEHLENEIKPALEKGMFVLCDRYRYSTVAYQAAQGADIAKLAEMNRRFLRPDACFILDIPPEQALERIGKDEKRPETEMFEREGFLEEVRGNFLRMPELFPKDSIIMVDATRGKEDVFREVEAFLRSVVEEG